MYEKVDTGDPASGGIRKWTIASTKHCLRPTPEIVAEYFEKPSEEAWDKYEASYLRILEERFERDRRPFDKLASLAARKDVYIGCYCPTKKNPDVWNCHTVLALKFMKEKYPDLEVVFPPRSVTSRALR